MNKPLYILAIAISINAINFNQSYCMETKTIYRENIMKVLQEKLNILSIHFKSQDINTKTLRYEITQFCDCLFGNNGHNLDTILSCNSRDILDKIRLILNRYYYVRIYLHDPLKNNTELYNNILRIVEVSKNDSKNVIKTKNYIKECVNYVKYKDLEIELRDICINIIDNNQVNKYISRFFNYLLGENWSHLKYILQYSKEETLNLIAKVLDLPNVRNILLVVRCNFIISQVNKYDKHDVAISKVFNDIITDINSLYKHGNNEALSIQDLMDVKGTIFEYLENNNIYTRNLKEVIKKYRNNLLNKAQNKSIAKLIIDSLIHEQLDGYADDMTFVYEKYQMLQKLFENKKPLIIDL